MIRMLAVLVALWIQLCSCSVVCGARDFVAVKGEDLEAKVKRCRFSVKPLVFVEASLPLQHFLFFRSQHLK